MSTPDNGGSGGTPNPNDKAGGSGGDAGGGQGGGSGATPPATATVSKAEFDRVLNELHGFKTEAKTLKEKLAKEEDDKLKANQQWQALAEKREKEAQDWRDKYQNLTGVIAKDKKISAMREEALKAGIRPEALPDLEMLDMKEVQVETTSTGRINVIGAEGAVKNLKAIRPHWFGSTGSPGVNTGTPGVTPPAGNVTLEQLKAADKKRRTTGDSSEYLKLHSLYQQQNKRGA